MVKLIDIVDVVQQFAEAGKAALKLDIEIIDENRRFIAGTGRIKSILGKEIKTDGAIVKAIFEKRKHYLIVENPGVDEICVGCNMYGKCEYLKAIYSTINYGERVLGVIGLAASQPEQVTLIEDNEQAMLDFLDKIAILISTKVQEREMLKTIETYTKMMDTAYDSINRGAIIVNKNYEMVRMNQYIIKKLKLDQNQTRGKKLNHVLPGITLSSQVGNLAKMKYEDLYYNDNDVEVDLLYASTPIFVEDELEMIIYFFEDYKAAKRFAFSITEQRDKITLDDIIGTDKSIISFKSKIRKFSRTDSTILLTGETGTGKELFARSIHEESDRKARPFIVINCGAIPETLIESELFGYEKGSFTGANKTGKHGKFYLADKGTVFLDEVENMPIYLQQKLLRVLERKEIERIGSEEYISIDVRIIAATNVDLKRMVDRGEFRQDLYHRLNVIPLQVPPLRERGDDVLVIAEYFINKFSQKFGKEIHGLSDQVKERFLTYDWKGNVRELQNTIEYAINMETGNVITEQSLPQQFLENMATVIYDNEIIKLEEAEKREIVKALNKYGWDDEGINKASKALGASRSTIYRRITKHKLKN